MLEPKEWIEQHKEWLDHPMTQEFRKSLRDKARSIRYQAYLKLELSVKDREYLYVMEDMIDAMDAGPVIEDQETIAKEAKKDGY
jgi:hypothetical protein